MFSLGPRDLGSEVEDYAAAVASGDAAQIDRAAEALTGGDTILCCTQEGRTFEALAEELGTDPAPLLDLRDRAPALASGLEPGATAGRESVRLLSRAAASAGNALSPDRVRRPPANLTL